MGTYSGQRAIYYQYNMTPCLATSHGGALVAFRKLCGLKMGEGGGWLFIWTLCSTDTHTHRHTHDLANIITVLRDLVQPSLDVDKRLWICDIINNNNPMGVPVIPGRATERQTQRNSQQEKRNRMKALVISTHPCIHILGEVYEKMASTNIGLRLANQYLTGCSCAYCTTYTSLSTHRSGYVVNVT